MWHMSGILVFETCMEITCFLSHDADDGINDTTAFVMLMIVQMHYTTFDASAGIMLASVTHDVHSTFHSTIAFLRLRQLYYMTI